MKAFMSFTPQDKPFADKLSQSLKKACIDPVSIDLQITYGEQLDEKILKGSPGFDYVVVLLSKTHSESEWLQNELLAFVALEKLRGTKIIFPIIIEDCPIPVYFKNRIAADFRNVDFEEGAKQLVSQIAVNRKAFVVMKFNDEDLNSAYLGVIKPVLTDAGYIVTRIDEVKDSSEINDQVRNEILGSALILADLSQERPNCYYEAGYAHALGKTVILTAREGTPIHFDLSTHRFIFWKNENHLRTQLLERLKDLKPKSNG
jgi:nucleoside 2-deoxyribosyltransferase